MINKKVDSIEEALKGVSDHMTFMLGGFGLCGIPENAIYFFINHPNYFTMSLILISFKMLKIYVVVFRDYFLGIFIFS